MISIFDGFISSYDDLKRHSLSCEYSTITNPVDGVGYPHINSDIPDNVKSEVLEKINGILGREPENYLMFLRKSPAGVDVPHIAHHDLSMGKFSLMLYLNDREDGGTAIIRHIETGITYAPASETFAAIVRNDQNNISKWALVEMAKMKENRAAIFDAGLMHCAMPIGGFGEGDESRVVFTVFFS